jgi:hypothetical protein
MPRISLGYRAALAAKGLLLLALTLTFVALVVAGSFDAQRPALLRLLFLGFALPAWFVGSTAGLAFADALLGRAIDVPGAVALRSRRMGYSLKLPDGHFAEFILFNPWGALVAEQRYAVTIGRYSRVVVQAPRPEP